MEGWNPQKPTKLDGNDTMIFSHHPYILCHLANYALCFVLVRIYRRVTVWNGSAGCVVHADVRGEVMLNVGGSNLILLSMAGVVCLVCRSYGVHEQC